MKKVNLIFIVINLCFFVVSNAQIGYYDSQKLNKPDFYYTDSLTGKLVFQDEEAWKILALYITEDATSDQQRLSDDFYNNPFIAVETPPKNASAQSFSVGTKNLASKIGGIDVTNFAFGLAGFIKDRAIEELNIVFFEKFDHFLKNNPEAGTLFPNTCTVASGLLGYQYPQMLPELQKAFQQDMESTPENTLAVLTLPKYFKDTKKFPEFLLVTKLFEFNYSVFNSDLSAPDYIDNLKSEIIKFVTDFNLQGDLEINNILSVIQFTSILSNSMRTEKGEDARNWVSTKDFYSNVLSNDTTRKIYLGLIYQKSKDLILNGNTLESIFLSKTSSKKLSNEVDWYSNQLSQLIVQLNQIDKALKTSKDKEMVGQKIDFEDISMYLNLTTQLWSYGINFAGHYDGDLKDNSTIKIIDYSAKSYNNIYLKKYGLAIDNIIDMVTAIDKSYQDRNGKELISETFLKNMNRYGKFIGYVAVAKTSQDVQDAINGIALPPGSASIKKYSTFTAEIGAYLGVAWNVPLDGVVENSTSISWNRKFGLTAPVGVNLAWSTLNNWSLGAFISVLDVGAIVDYQLTDSTNTTTNLEQKIYLKNILSPGAYFVVGVKNYPISLGVGAQYGPGLFKYQANGVEIFEPSWRVNVTLAMDLPIIKLGSKPRQKSK